MLTKHTIQHFDLWDTDFDDLCLFTAQLSVTLNQYDRLAFSVPEWLQERSTEVSRVLLERVKVQKLAELKRLRSRRETLLTTDEKRKQVEDLITKLETETK